MLPIILPLLPLLGQLFPALGRLVGGAGGEDIAQRVVNGVQDIVGSTTPDDVAQALHDPEKAGALLARLREIEAEGEKARIEAETQQLVARLADLQNARSAMLALVTQRSPMALGAALVSAVVLMAFLWTLVADAAALPIAPETRRLVEYALISVLGFWIGTSHGAQEMRRGIQAQAQGQPPPARPEATPRPLSGARP